MAQVNLFDRLLANCQQRDAAEGGNVSLLCRAFINECGGKADNINYLVGAFEGFDEALTKCPEELKTFKNKLTLKAILVTTINNIRNPPSIHTPNTANTANIPNTPNTPNTANTANTANTPITPISPIRQNQPTSNNTQNQPTIPSFTANQIKSLQNKLPAIPCELYANPSPTPSTDIYAIPASKSTKRKPPLRNTVHSKHYQKNQEFKSKWIKYVNI